MSGLTAFARPEAIAAYWHLAAERQWIFHKRARAQLD